jgi:hypothetical protein
MSDLVIRPATKTDVPDIAAMLADDSLGDGYKLALS